MCHDTPIKAQEGEVQSFWAGERRTVLGSRCPLLMSCFLLLFHWAIPDRCPFIIAHPAPGAGDGQGSLAGCSPWGRKELDTAERLGNSNIINRAPGKERASLRSVSHSS